MVSMQEKTGDAYRTPDEKTPQPEPPKPPGWWSEKWSDYRDLWRREKVDAIFYTFFILPLVGGVIVCAIFGIRYAILCYLDPCADEEISVEFDNGVGRNLNRLDARRLMCQLASILSKLDAREKEQTSRALIKRLHDKAFNYPADPILEEAALEIERLLSR